MEARFAHLEALVTNMASNMVAHVKPHAYGSGGIKDQENTPFFGLDPRYFYGAGFSRPLAPNDVLMDILGNNVLGVFDDGNPFKVLEQQQWLGLILK